MEGWNTRGEMVWEEDRALWSGWMEEEWKVEDGRLADDSGGSFHERRARTGGIMVVLSVLTGVFLHEVGPSERGLSGFVSLGATNRL